MARARFIRPEFFTDEKVSDLPFGAALLFAGIWCQADLRGVFEHSPRLLRGLIFPMRDGIDTVTIGDWLNVLERSGLIRRFESEGKSWGVVKNWSRYQEIATREIEIGSRRPAPPDWSEPERWPEIVEKARKSGRIASGSSWNVPEQFQNGSRTVLEQFQNPTATATATPTATATATPTYETRARADDLCSPTALTAKPATDADHWQMAERHQEWARSLKSNLCKIGRDNWTAWKALVDAHGLPMTLSAARGVQATERWPDRVQSTITASRGQINPGDVVKSKTIRITL